jgi:hypothetical protein
VVISVLLVASVTGMVIAIRRRKKQ